MVGGLHILGTIRILIFLLSCESCVGRDKHSYPYPYPRPHPRPYPSMLVLLINWIVGDTCFSVQSDLLFVFGCRIADGLRQGPND